MNNTQREALSSSLVDSRSCNSQLALGCLSSLAVVLLRLTPTFLYNTHTIWLALCCSFSLHIGRCYAITFTALSQKKPSRRIVAFCSLHLFRALQFVYVSSSSLSYRMLLLVVVAVTRFEFVWICWKNSSSRKKCSSSLVIGLYDDFADIVLSWLIY